MIEKARAQPGGLPILNLLIGSFYEAVGLKLRDETRAYHQSSFGFETVHCGCSHLLGPWQLRGAASQAALFPQKCRRSEAPPLLWHLEMPSVPSPSEI